MTATQQAWLTLSPPAGEVAIWHPQGDWVVGHAVMRLDSDTGRAGFDLTELFVTPAQRGQGTGRRLIAAARALTEAEGQVRLRLRNLPGARGPSALRLGETPAISRAGYAA